jgi:SAM-dependent methyltransferase
MADTSQQGYDESEQQALEQIWGDGFLSPGGPAEVARIIGDHGVAGASVLDIGSGRGGVDILLARVHEADCVVGIDVQADMVAHATQRAAAAGLSDRVRFEVVAPGPLPFEDSGFDVVFSKDAIVHVADKRALYQEVFRVLRPDGRLFVGDWLRGPDEHLDSQVDDFVTAAGGAFTMVSLDELTTLVGQVGFVDVETEDRCDWYLGEAQVELARLREQEHELLVERLGAESIEARISFWDVLVASLEAGALRPAHLRARKPTE